MTCVIDAYERRDVATLDIPGAFLQTRMPDGEEKVHVMLEGRIAELLAKIAPGVYQEYVHHKQGQAYIYCVLNVAFYGVNKITQTSNEGLGLRGAIWTSTWFMIQERPWLGHVIHSFQPSFFLQGYAVEAMMVMENPHNMFLQMAVACCFLQKVA